MQDRLRVAPPAMAVDADAVVSAIIEGIQDAVWIIGAGNRIVRFNAAFSRYSSRVFGIVPREGLTTQELLAGAEPERIREFWENFLARATNGARIVADAWYPIDGIKRYFVVSATPIESDGRASGTTVVVRDITESRTKVHRDSIELTLMRIFSEDRSFSENLGKVLEFLAEMDSWDFVVAWLFPGADESLAAMAFAHDDTPRAREFEQAIRDLRFTPGHGIPGRALREDAVVWVPDLTDETGALRSRLAAELGFRGVVAVPIRDSRRSIGVLECFTRAVRPMDHDTARALDDTGCAIGRIIERDRAEEERRRLNVIIERKGTEWAQTFDAIELPIFLASTDARVARLNRPARELVGAAYGEIVGKALADISDGELWRTVSDLVAAVAQSRASCTAEALGVGDRYWDISGSMYEANDPADERVIVVLRDITTLVKLQESVRRGEQLAALGELVAGVAHEVRNPLFGMSATLYAFEPILKENSDAAEMFVALRTWIARLNALMENLLEYGKTWNVNLQSGNIDTVVEQAINQCLPLAESMRIRVKKQGSGSDAPILMDAPRLAHAIQNVIMNAIQHAPGETDVEVALSVMPVSRVIECVVRDHGPGFRKTDLPRVFQPFFTRRRGGTGLGLSIVQRVVDEHGGTVSAENASSGGAVVTMRFPLFRLQ